MDSQNERYHAIHQYFEKFQDLTPELAEAYEALPRAAYAEGALDTKTKRLMAMAAALTHGCRGCILFQTEHALKQGASVEEILEACGVAMSLGGTMAAAETVYVVKYLEEKGLV